MTESHLEPFHPVVRRWFSEAFAEATAAQMQAWPVIAQQLHTLLLAPTGSGKTLAAFLVALDRIMFGTRSDDDPPGVRVLYISPLKALGVDVQRNLRAPLAGIRAVAQRSDTAYREPQIGVRSGDTSSVDRQRLVRQPPDILITTPESLFLILTSRARQMLRTVETVIIDEIHTMVATKRGAHLFLSLERLEQLRGAAQGLQRIGLSATQRPLDEIARLLGGATWDAVADLPRPRPVTIVEAGRSRDIRLRIEVPVDDMTQLASANPTGTGDDGTPGIPSIWPALHPRLIELVRAHRSTMIFVNSRRLAERLATSINETAGEELALAHHGSIAKATRQQIEDRLKQGQLPAIVATSSLELGIDMGAVDLVIQIEAPPTIASGIQRIGRASHHVGGTSSGVVFPKYRGDLLACSAAAQRVLAGEVESTYYPRNPLDVLAQQIVAMTAEGPIEIDAVYQLSRGAAPFHDLPRSSFESVLDLLAGRYPSSEFSELRPRINWDRLTGTLTPRKSTQRLAVVNAGTIPDRGLYGVFLVGDENGNGGSRVGELDEEMVFETRPGDIFLLGASSWRVTDITNDRVLVVPAPGEPGRMPFWRGDGPGRPYEFGRAIGQLARELTRMPRPRATQQLQEAHCLDSRAAKNLVQYLHDQIDAAGEVPSDRTLIVESFLDELGDWRIAILSPFGARVHAPWAMAVAAQLREQTGDEIDLMWTDDGMLFRLADGQSTPSLALLFPSPQEIESMVVNELGSTALFAGRFRENAARALLLPRRQPGRRTPLWLQRRRAADLLTVAARYPSFPIILETYRECLRDVFDLSSLKTVLQSVADQSLRIHQVQTETASPFAASLLFSYTANFIYNGDSPLAERRAQTLALDHAQLNELLGAAELRELLCVSAVDELSIELQRLDERYAIRDPEHIQDTLRSLGDLSADELSARCDPDCRAQLDGWIQSLVQQRQVVPVRVAGQSRLVAVEDIARYRDGLGIVPPMGLPSTLLEPVEAPLADLLIRYARTHLPFAADAPAARFGLSPASVQEVLQQLVDAGRLVAGEFLPGGRGREWTDPNVLRALKRRSLAHLRQQVEPVDQTALARFLPDWQGLDQPRRGLDGLLDVVEQLQGIPLAGTVLEGEILPNRLVDFQPSALDELCAAGEIVWRGFESLGSDDGKIALYLADHFPQLAPPANETEDEESAAIATLLGQRGALFFDQIVQHLGGFRHDLLTALWQLVWAGRVTNDTLAPLRSRRKSTGSRHRRQDRKHRSGRFRSRRAQPTPGSEGRWTLLDADSQRDATERQLAIAQQLIQRYGVLTREMVNAEGVNGGFAGIYPVLKAMEESGRVRRGYFVAGLGAAQFAAPGADDRLRQFKEIESHSNHRPWQILAATDPANPYGAALPWPQSDEGQTARPGRAAGARVILVDGRLVAYLGKTGQSMLTFLAEDDADAERQRQQLVDCLVSSAAQRPVLLARINGVSASQSPLAEGLIAQGFANTSRGLLKSS